MKPWSLILGLLLAGGGATWAAERSLDAVLDELALGVSPKEALPLLADLGKRKDARSIEVLELYTRNRTPEVRKRALEALAEFSSERAGNALVAALSDASPEVRAFAEVALTKRKVPGVEAKLLRLLEKGDPAAPSAVAAVATPELAHRLSERLGQLPDNVLASTFGEILKRSDFGNDKVREEIVKTLAKIPGADSTVALQEYVARTAKGDKKLPSRVAAEKIIEERTK